MRAGISEVRQVCVSAVRYLCVDRPRRITHRAHGRVIHFTYYFFILIARISSMITPHFVSGPLLNETRFKDVKDPCIVFDGKIWHIYGSGGDVTSEVWSIFHATATHIIGPWQENDVVQLNGVRGDHVAAPSVYYDATEQVFHMMVQTEFMRVGGTVEYLVSNDGHTFERVNTVLESQPQTSEAGVYDPHQLIVGDRKYVVYAGTPEVMGTGDRCLIQPDVHLAECDNQSLGWEGPWTRQGIILDHDEIDWHHNPRHHVEYEWGIEGPQIICLPDGRYLLNATSFQPGGKFGTRQRVFFAIADAVTGPYTSLGPVLNPFDFPELNWMSGENGHATVVIDNDQIVLFFQARSQALTPAEANNWQYGIATYALSDILNLCSDNLKEAVDQVRMNHSSPQSTYTGY